MEKHKDFIFLTLTAPNVTGDKLLKEEIGRYNKAFNNLMGRDEVKRAVKGYIRKLEVTYNKNRIITPEMWYGNKKKHIKAMGYYFQSLGLKIGDKNPNYNTYHPHFHVMIAINKSYFTSRDYITPKHWLELWQEVMQDTTITQVDVVRVRLDAAGKEISEIAKYTAKDSDYTVSEEVFGAYYRALTHRQKITYGGLFAEAGKMYDNGELNDYRDKDLTEYIYELFYKWEKAKGEYLLEDVRELTPEERTKYHGQAVEEMNIED